MKNNNKLEEQSEKGLFTFYKEQQTYLKSLGLKQVEKGQKRIEQRDECKGNEKCKKNIVKHAWKGEKVRNKFQQRENSVLRGKKRYKRQEKIKKGYEQKEGSREMEETNEMGINQIEMIKKQGRNVVNDRKKKRCKVQSIKKSKDEQKRQDGRDKHEKYLKEQHKNNTKQTQHSSLVKNDLCSLQKSAKLLIQKKLNQMNSQSNPQNSFSKKISFSQTKISMKPFKTQQDHDLLNYYNFDSNIEKGNQKSLINFTQTINFTSNNCQFPNSIIQSSNLHLLHQNFTLNIDSQQFNIKDKFLSNVIRKKLSSNKSYNQIDQNIPQQNKICSFKKQIAKFNNLEDKKLFKNDHISKSMFFKNPYQYVSKTESPNSRIEKKVVKPQIIRMKTQNIHPLHRIFIHLIYQKNKQVSIIKKYLINSDLNKRQQDGCYLDEQRQKSNNFDPIHKSSFACPLILNTQNTQNQCKDKNWFQYYKKIKINKNKILRFSVIKNSSVLNYKNSLKNQISLNSKEKKLKNLSNVTLSIQNINQQSNLLEQKTENQHLKLPLISKALSVKYNRNDKHKKTEAQNFRALQSFLNEENKLKIKKRLRMYYNDPNTEAPATEEINFQNTQIIKPFKLEKNENLKISLSESKIISSFHQKYYKDTERQKLKNKNIISKLDFYENSVFRYQQSLDWENKKKLIKQKFKIQL